MGSSRSIRNRGRKKGKIEVPEIDITSLLDILVILLVFLLKSYNATGVIINVPDDIILPTSVSDNPSSAGVLVHVSATKIWVEDKPILNMDEQTQGVFDHGGRRILPLYNALVARKNEIEQIEKSAPNAEKFSGLVNLVIDKNVGYNYMKKLLYTSAEAGYRRYKFVVQGQEQ